MNDWNETESARLRKLSLEYRMNDEDKKSLAELLISCLKLDSLKLDGIDACVWPVFRGRVGNGNDIFIKVAPEENVRRTLSFIRETSGCELVPSAMADEPIRFGFRSVLCTEWRDCNRVPAEEMTDSQTDSFLSGVMRLSEAMRNVRDVLDENGRDSPTRQYAIVADWAKNHPLAAKLIAPILDIPTEEREYGTRKLTVIHGDMHMKNYGFDGERLSTVFDFDTVIRGLPCEDVSYAFTERMRRSAMGMSAKRRLMELFGRVVSASPWGKAEWRIAVNHARLRIASRRLNKHPHNPLTAIDVAKRDRELRPLLEVLR